MAGAVAIEAKLTKRVHAEIPIGHFAIELPNLLQDAMREGGKREAQFDTNEVNICLESVSLPAPAPALLQA